MQADDQALTLHVTICFKLPTRFQKNILLFEILVPFLQLCNNEGN